MPLYIFCLHAKTIPMMSSWIATITIVIVDPKFWLYLSYDQLYAAYARDLVGPDGAPTMMADENTENDAVKFMQKAIEIPGVIKGNMTLQNICRLFAPSVVAAFSRVGLIPETYPRSNRKPIGKF